MQGDEIVKIRGTVYLRAVMDWCPRMKRVAYVSCARAGARGVSCGRSTRPNSLLAFPNRGRSGKNEGHANS